jgi:hypothetical protein
LSVEAVATLCPSGAKATPRTAAAWPASVWSEAPSATFQSRAVLSADPEASVWPSGENATP